MRFDALALTGGVDVFDLAAVRAHLASISDVLRDQAHIELVEESVERFTHANCDVDYDTGEGSHVADGAPRGVLPIVFVSRIHSATSAFGIGGHAQEGGAVVTTAIGAGSTVTLHEIGHFLGLAHTHDCSHGRETAENCATAGDMFCDTLPDRGPSGINGLDTCDDGTTLNGSCAAGCGVGTCADGSTPDRDNFMGYYHCWPGHLSREQADYARCQLSAGALAHFNASEVCAPTELCNGLDDDCDGEVDEVTRPCGVSAGECRPGVQRCESGRWQSTCEGATGAGAEVCDGLDNDCDGMVDEDVNPLADPAGFRCPTLGICASGGARARCVSGAWRCEMPAGYVADECPVTRAACGLGALTDARCRDGRDNDCDGVVDEHNAYPMCTANPNFGRVARGEACFVSTLGRCGRNGGTYQCVQLAEGCGVNVDCVGATFPEAERCDGQDWDCDGRTYDANDADGDGYGNCAGRVDCRDDLATVHPGAVEECNNRDDNCNGAVDEGLSRDCSNRCGGGTSTCRAGVWGACTAPTTRACSTCGWPGSTDCGTGACNPEGSFNPAPSSSFFGHGCGFADGAQWYVPNTTDTFCDALYARGTLPQGRYSVTLQLWGAGGTVAEDVWVDVWIGGRQVATDYRFHNTVSFTWAFDMPAGCTVPDIRVRYRGGIWTTQMRVVSTSITRLG